MLHKVLALLGLITLIPLLAVVVPAPCAYAQSSGGFVQFSTGAYHNCLVKSDGSAVCWGRNDYGQATPPAEPFTQVSAGFLHTCGLKRDGTLACWGSDLEGIASPPAGTFTQVSASRNLHNCALRSDATVACWGLNDHGQSTAPSGTFTQVTTGSHHSCGLRSDGTVACWGDNDYGQATPPAGTFTQIEAGGYYNCGVRSDGTLACWGDNSKYGEAVPPGGTFTQVSAGVFHTCGINSQGSIVCWGSNLDGEATPPAGTFIQVSAGDGHTCGLRSDGGLACWGFNNYGHGSVPLQTGPAFTANSTASTTDHLCLTAHCTLREAIEAANNDGQSSTVALLAGGVYTLNEDHRGGAALPWISSPVTINGHGAILERSPDAGTPGLRLAVVEVSGTLALYQAVVRDFYAPAAYGGVIYNNGTVTIDSSALHSNAALRGGAVHNNNGTVTIVNSTLYNNSATEFGGAVLNLDTLNLLSSTLAGNRCPSGGALYSDGSRTAVVKGTIFVRGASGANCAAVLASGSTGNVADDSSCGTSARVKTAAEIGLAAPADNGGPTPTMALKPTSALIDAGDPYACLDVHVQMREQRGYSRFADGNGDGVVECDPGAFEYGSLGQPPAAMLEHVPPETWIELDPQTPDGAHGWYRSAVTVLPQASDASPVVELRCALDPAGLPATFEDLPPAPCPFRGGAPVTADGQHTLYAAAMDLWGNKSAPVSASFQLDATPPLITCPAAGPFLLGSGDQAVGPAAVDASVCGLDEAASTLSGVVPTDKSGPRMLTFTAVDLAGNQASRDCPYAVIYDFGGFYPPVEPAPVLNEARAGSAVPLKFSLAGDQGFDVIVAGYPASQPVACDTLQTTGPSEPTEPAGRSGLSYDEESGWYNAIWKTERAWVGTCRLLTIQLADGTVHSAHFKFH